MTVHVRREAICSESRGIKAFIEPASQGKLRRMRRLIAGVAELPFFLSQGRGGGREDVVGPNDS